MNWILLVVRLLVSILYPPSSRGLGSLAIRRDGRVRIVRQDDPWQQLREVWSRLTNCFEDRPRPRRAADRARPPCGRDKLLRGVD